MDTNDLKKHFQKMNSVKKVESEFPVSVLPKKIQSIIEAKVEDLNFITEFIAAAIIHAAGSAIGNSIRLGFKWEEAPTTYMALIGDPGSGKSHPIEWAYKPLNERDQQNYKKYIKEVEAYESGEQTLDKKKPVLKRMVVNNTTIEALNAALMDNPRGVCVVADELSGFLSAMGKNQQQYLSHWSRKPLTIIRKTHKTIIIKSPFVSMIGTMQTSILGDVLRKGNKLENGFLDRILLVKPKINQDQKWKEKPSENNSEKEWDRIINVLLDLPLPINEEGNIMPQIIHFTDDAENIVLDYMNYPPTCSNEISDEIIKRITQKMVINFLRLCIILQLLRWACGEGEKDAIDTDSVKSAVAISEFFKKTAFNVWEELSKRNPLDLLTDQKRSIYEKLGDNFSTAWGIGTAEKYLMPERTFKNWIRDAKLFKRIGYGSYEKVYKSK